MKGVITVEAALIIPIVMSVFLLAMQGGIDLYTQVRQTAEMIREEQDMEIVPIFYRWKGLEGLQISGDRIQ